MDDFDLAPLVRDPSMTTPAAARALLTLVDAVTRDPDIAGDVTLMLTEQLMPGGTLRAALTMHPNPCALLTTSAKHSALDAIKHAERFKRVIHLTDDGDLLALEIESASLLQPTEGIFDLLEDLGWTPEDVQALAIPRQRAGRSIHPGIEDALDKIARCFGIRTRCSGCPDPMDLQRLDLNGPGSWPALVLVAREWGWSEDLIAFLTTSPANIAHWRRIGVTAPRRQESRMIKVAHKMRWQPWLLTDPHVIRESVMPRDPRLGPPPWIPPAAGPGQCRMVG